MDSWLPLPWILLFLDTLRPRDAVGSEGVAALWSGFCARSLHSCRKLQRSHCEHWPFFFPLVADTFSSFNAVWSCFNSLVPGVKISQSKFPIYIPPHHGFQLLIVGNRYLLMNLHVVQFQYGFELRRLAYPQLVQTFQNIIGWNF